MFQSILLDSTSGTLKEWFQNLWNDTGFVVDYSRFEGYSLGIWGCLIMLVVACFLVYLAVVKKFEPMLLVGIAFGAFLINIPGAYDALMASPLQTDNPEDFSGIFIRASNGLFSRR